MRRGYGIQDRTGRSCGGRERFRRYQASDGQMKGPALERFDESRDAAKFWCKGGNRAGDFGHSSFFFLAMPGHALAAAFVIETRQRVMNALLVLLFHFFSLFLCFAVLPR